MSPKEHNIPMFPQSFAHNPPATSNNPLPLFKLKRIYNAHESVPPPKIFKITPEIQIYVQYIHLSLSLCTKPFRC